MRIVVQLICLLLVVCQSAMSLQEYSEFQLQNPQNLLQQLQLDSAQQNHPKIEKLIFLTPWNKMGFTYTLQYSHKIDYVSPCWYSLRIGKSGDPQFENEHNYDPTFSHSLREKSPRTKLVPRIYVQGSDINFFQTIGSNQMKFKQAVELIIKIVKEKQLDGFVWDTPYNFYESSRASLNQLITEFIKAVRLQLGPSKIILFNMANPMEHMRSLQVNLYKQLPVNAILIQNYDKGDDYLKMIDKSLQWSRQLESKIKVILMLPFFSVKVGVGSLSTGEAVKSLKKLGVAAAALHKGICKFSEAKSKRSYLIPCYSYFKKVFDLAEKASAGVGFWEGGNGLENYYKFL